MAWDGVDTELTEEVYLVCPIAGKQCPGRDKCGPAMYSQVQTDAGGDPQPECPIVKLVDSIGVIGMSLYPILEQHLGAIESNSPPRSREEWIEKNLKPDQMMGAD
jgi:hypothetical protein